MFFIKGVLDWPFSGERIGMFTAEKFTRIMMLSEYRGEFGLQHRFLSKCYLPKFTSKEKSRGYAIYSCSRIGPIEGAI